MGNKWASRRVTKSFGGVKKTGFSLTLSLSLSKGSRLERGGVDTRRCSYVLFPGVKWLSFQLAKKLEVDTLLQIFTRGVKESYLNTAQTPTHE